MQNNTKHLSFQSFQRNQTLLEALNNYILHLKLRLEEIDDMFSPDEIDQAKNRILNFLKRLAEITADLEAEPAGAGLYGLDERFKSLINRYMEAKKKKAAFKSVLFRQNPEVVIREIQHESPEKLGDLIQSLSELERLIEDHILIDVKEVIGDI